ncbi:MAG: ArsB/NhaD family transporter, partial [Acidimicrobiia bacterium]
GAGLILVTKVLSAEEAFHSLEMGVDWDVIFLLLGMMLIVGVLWETGLFEYLAIWSAKRAGGRPFRILVILSLVTAVASALLDNVTTVLLVAPVTLLIAERLGVSAVPYLLAEALASNIGGTATLIGDPPNIIIASVAGLSYLDFVVNLAPIVVLLLVIFLFMAKPMFGKSLEGDPERVAEVMSLNEREAITNPGLLIRSLAVLTVVTLAFLFHSFLGYEPVVIALIGGGLLLLVSGLDQGDLLKDIEWGTLAFFLGLFVMVGGLIKTGVIETIAEQASTLTGGRTFLASMLVLVISGALSGIVDNIPYVAAMAPVVSRLTSELSSGNVLWWSLALGADLGGNATAVGASANVVVVGLAARAGQPISFFEFLKYGGLVTVVTVAVSAAYIWFRYFAIA